MLGLLRKAVRKFRNKSQNERFLEELDVGEGTRLSPANLDGMFPHLVRIGKNCIFAPTAKVLTHDASYYLLNGEYRIAPVVIGDNVFLGYGSIIMPGVTIGSNVVIGAGSVVTKDVPDDSVVAGVPGRIIRTVPDDITHRKSNQVFPPHTRAHPPTRSNASTSPV